MNDDTNKTPIDNGAITRTKRGTFAKGNKGGPGASMLAQRVHKLRAKMLDRVTQERMSSMIDNLMKIACQDEDKFAAIAAARVILDRTFGKSKVEIEVTHNRGLDLEAKQQQLLNMFGVKSVQATVIQDRTQPTGSVQLEVSTVPTEEGPIPPVSRAFLEGGTAASHPAQPVMEDLS